MESSKSPCFGPRIRRLTHTRLWDYGKRKAPPRLYHPGKPRNGDAISGLFLKKKEIKNKERKCNALKQVPLAAADPPTVEGDDDAGAAGPTVETGTPRQKVPEVSKPSNVSGAGNKDNCKVVDDKEEGSTPANKESNKITGKSKVDAEQTAKTEMKRQVSAERSLKIVSESGKKECKKVVDEKKKARMPVKKDPREGGKVDGEPKMENGDPPVDLKQYVVSMGRSGLYSIEISSLDKIGSSRGWQLTLELFESKSDPKTYLFGARKFNAQDSGSCERYFPSKFPGDKECELTELRKFFQEFTGVDWHQRDSVRSTGPYYYQSSALPGRVIDSVDRKDKSDQPGGFKEHNSIGSDANSREPCDRNFLLKRKRSFSEEPQHTAKTSKASKKSKTVVDIDSAKAKHG